VGNGVVSGVGSGVVLGVGSGVDCGDDSSDTDGRFQVTSEEVKW
jgi:hypothetical protein